MIQLRDYQQEAKSAVLENHKQGVTRPLVSLPTGTGKTIVFGAVVKERGGRALVLAHRDELLTQAAEKISLVYPQAEIGRIKAEENDFEDKQIVCASVQTLTRPKRLEQIAHAGFDTMIIDEAHHAPALSYRRILSYLGFMEGNAEKLALGVTATAGRGDGVGLGNVFEKIVYQSNILTMIRAGYLSDIKGIRVRTEADLSSVGTRQGDFIESQLSLAVNTPERNNAIVGAYLQNAANRKTIGFCVDVAHAEDLAQAFNDNGVIARALSGKTPEDERKEILRAFSRGEIQVITNCQILTEGFDEPAVDCILMARPTKSTTLYTQCIGRGTRLFPGKDDCIVIDFADNRHDICALPTLLGFSLNSLARGESVRETAEVEDKKKQREKAVAQLHGEIVSKEYDLLGKSKFRWFKAGEQWRLPVAPGVYAVLNPHGDRYHVVLAEKDQAPRLLHEIPLPVTYGMGIAEDFARSQGQAFSRKDAPWRKHEATEKQIETLKKFGLYYPGITKGEASDKLEKFFAGRQRRITVAG
jgi:ATP-dependent helicase IRC3